MWFVFFLIRQFVFHRLVAILTCVWMIQMVKHIQLHKDNKSNHDCQYVAKLESNEF